MGNVSAQELSAPFHTAVCHLCTYLFQYSTFHTLAVYYASFYLVQKMALFATSVCDFIFELAYIRVVKSYARLS